jgi:urease accessory protein
MSDFLTWQIVDSAFPTGLFAHSWGLESAWQHGEIGDADGVRAFAEEAIVQAGHATLPFVNAAFDTPEALDQFDLLADAFLANPVANRASRIQGRTLLATAVRVWPSTSLAALKTTTERTCAHVAPLCGAIFQALGLSRGTAHRVVLYGAARGVLSAAVRLGVVGGFEAQRIQYECTPLLERVAEQGAGIGLAGLAQTAPLIDLFQARHDLLYSRLFQS